MISATKVLELQVWEQFTWDLIQVNILNLLFQVQTIFCILSWIEGKNKSCWHFQQFIFKIKLVSCVYFRRKTFCMWPMWKNFCAENSHENAHKIGPRRSEVEIQQAKPCNLWYLWKAILQSKLNEGMAVLICEMIFYNELPFLSKLISLL